MISEYRYLQLWLLYFVCSNWASVLKNWWLCVVYMAIKRERQREKREGA